MSLGGYVYIIRVLLVLAALVSCLYASMLVAFSRFSAPKVIIQSLACLALATGFIVGFFLLL